MPKRKKSNRVQIGLRLREEMRRDLETVAKEHGISMNAEIESRLERSFWDDETRQADIHYRFGGATNYAIALAMAVIMRQFDGQVFASWTENEFAYRRVREAFDTFLDGIAPAAGASKTGGRFVSPTPEDKISGKESAQYLLKILPLIGAIRRKRLAKGYPSLEPHNLREIIHQVAPAIVPLISRKESDND